MAAPATVLVTHLTGQAWVRGTDGSLVPLREGMRIAGDAEIVTAAGASVQVQADGMPPVTIGEGQDVTLTADLVSPPSPSEAAIAVPADVTVDSVIAAINAGQDPLAQLDPTQATLAGGGGGGSHSFVRLGSVLELTTPLALSYPLPTHVDPDIRLGGAEPGTQTPGPGVPGQPGQDSVTLTSDPRVTEGHSIVVTATVSSPVTGADLVITLGNGATITIPVGHTSASVAVPSRPDDVYEQGEQPVEFTIAGTVGGGYGSLDTSSSTTTIVVDDADPTRVTVTADPAKEGDASVGFHFALSNPPQAGHPATLTVEVGGVVYTVALDADGKGTLNVPNPNAEDVYTDPSTLTATVTAINGGNFEATDVAGASAAAGIADTVDATTVSVTADPAKEGDASVGFHFALSNPPQAGHPATLTVEVGGVVYTVALDADGKGTLNVPNPNAEDVYTDPSTLTATVTAINGGNFEATDVAGASATAGIADTVNTTQFGLTSDVADVAGGGGFVTYTVTLGNTDGLPVDGHSGLEVTLSSGQTVTLAAGSTTGSVTVYTPANTTVSVTGVSYPHGGLHFESTDFGSASVGLVPGQLVPDPNDPDTVTGGRGDDILVGDRGGVFITAQPGVNYNVALLVDVSGSMSDPSGTSGKSRMQLAIDGLKHLVDELAGHDGTVNVVLIRFNSGARTEFTLNDLTAANVDGLKAAIDHLTTYGSTNYEAAFDQALAWFAGQPDPSAPGSNYQNLTYFLTDGNPTVNNANTTGSANSTNQADMQRAMDKFDLLGDLSAVHAIGIGDDINAQYLQFFDNTSATGTGSVLLADGATVSGEVGQPTIIHTAEQLEAALMGGGTTVHPYPLGGDTLIGGEGADIIFGDSINTDGGALDWASVGGRPSDLPDGSGMLALERFLELQNGGTPATAGQIYDYVQAHHAELAPATDPRGSDDILIGGAGDDILYGQGGDDAFVWRAGDQGTVDRPAHDTVMDFGNDSHGGPGHVDKLDLSDLLQGEESSGDLSQYLHFAKDGGDTVVKVSSAGHLAADGSGYDQLITLHGVDLAASVTGSYADQNGLIQKLIDAGKLAVDHH